MSLATREKSQPRQPGTARIELTLLAPNNLEACVKGSFSDWKDVPMQKGDDGRFRVQIDLADGTYPYRFKVRSKSWFFEPDQWVELVDPYATALDPKAENGILTIAGGRRVVDTYVWKNDDKPLPPNQQLVIYEMHLADFTGGGRFLDLIEKLDYLVELGVNAIELMPIKDNPGRYSWGYNPRHFFAVDTDYGTSEDLKHLVDECHGRGIRVFIDGVYNHAETSSPLTQIDHDYWFCHEAKDKEFNWGPEFNYEFHDERIDLWPARQYITDTVGYWVREYHLDGIRYDATRQIDNFDALRSFVHAADEAAGPRPFYNVAEYVPQNPAVTNLDGPMDAAWHDNFYHCMIEHLTHDTFDMERLKSVIDGRREGFGAAVNIVNYCSNHDHNHVLADLGDKGMFDEVAFAKRRQGAILCFTALGVPLLWMGEEFGEFQYKTEGESHLHWELLDSERNRGLFQFYQLIIRLRTTHPALFGDNIDFFYEHVENRVLGYLRWEGEDGIIVLANLGGNALTADIPNFPPGKWVSLFDSNVALEGNAQSIPLLPFATHVFVRA